VALAVVTCFLFKTNDSNQQAAFNLQSQCAQNAKSFVSANDPSAGYANAYNSINNKCFVELTHNEVNNSVGGYNYTGDVWDAQAGPSGKIYAQVNILIPEGQNEFNYSAGEVIVCSVGQTQCTSLGQFNSLVKSTYGIDIVL
jgi:hypothetical protein